MLVACVDTEPRCAGWADSGECQANPGYMLLNCRLSCDECTPVAPIDCVDSDDLCELRAAAGECVTDVEGTELVCAHSCNTKNCRADSHVPPGPSECTDVATDCLTRKVSSSIVVGAIVTSLFQRIMVSVPQTRTS